MPSGPSIMSLPGTGKSFDQFRADDFECRQFASSQAGGPGPNQAATDNAVSTAAAATAVGAAAGALIDGSSRGAGVGAGIGLLMGSAIGSSTANASAYAAQKRYDFGYTQCMYAKGHKVPVSGRFMAANERPARRRYYTPPPPPPNYMER